MKKILTVVMAMLLSLSMVAGCGGGDKKAELIKGLKTEIGTMLGNVDKLAADELKGDAAKKATEGFKGLMDKIAKLKEAAKGNAAAEKDVADLMGKATGLSEKISRGLAAGNLNIDPKTFKLEDMEKNGWVAINAAGKITGYYDPKDGVTDDLGKKAYAWIMNLGKDGKELNFSNVAFDYAAGKVALNKEAVLENKDGAFSFAAAKEAIKSLVWGDGVKGLEGLDLNGIFEKLKPQGWDMKKLAGAVAGAVAGDAAKAGAADKTAFVKDFMAFADKNEATLKKLADSINSGTIDKAALLELGKNALAEIKKANGDLNGKYADLLKPVANIMKMQEDRAQAMIDGVNGNLARFAEGGDLKTKALELLAQFKKENNL